MIDLKKSTRLAVKMAAAAFTLFALTQCTEREEIIAVNTQPQTEETLAIADENSEEPALSLTIDGIHTVLSSTKDCKTCTYFVPEDATVVDGKELGIKPGEAICLKAGVLYGNLSIINLEGEEDKPITIAYGVETIHTETDESETDESASL